MVCDYVMPYPMTHDGYVLGIIGLYFDCDIIWFGLSVLHHGCNVLKVLGICILHHICKVLTVLGII